MPHYWLVDALVVVLAVTCVGSLQFALQKLFARRRKHRTQAPK